MTDLLDKFEELLDEYRELIEASERVRDAYAIMQFHHTIGDAARDALDFLIEHAVTVTFDTADPSALAAEHNGFVWVADHPDGPNWYPVQPPDAAGA